MRKWRKIPLSGEHKEFYLKYHQSRYNPGLYNRIYFPPHDTLAVVHPKTDDIDSCTWGLVNMQNQYILPFEYYRIRMFGKNFILAEDEEGCAIYNRNGKKLHDIYRVGRTKNSAYWIVRDLYGEGFWLTIDRRSISNSLYNSFKLHDDGIMFLCKEDTDRCGIIRYSKLLLPFDYVALSSFSAGYCLGIKTKDDMSYLCELIKVRSRFCYPNPIHSTNIIVKDNMSEDYLFEFMNDKDGVQKILDSLVCYNEKVEMNYSTMEWFNNGMISSQLEDEEDDEENDDNYDREEYQWTDEDAWDAMTDGQYGDYPGSGWDSEMFGY